MANVAAEKPQARLRDVERAVDLMRRASVGVTTRLAADSLTRAVRVNDDVLAAHHRDTGAALFERERPTSNRGRPNFSAAHRGPVLELHQKLAAADPDVPVTSVVLGGYLCAKNAEYEYTCSRT